MADRGFEIRLLREDDLREESGFFQTMESIWKNNFPRDIEKMKALFQERFRRGFITYVVVVDGTIVATISTFYEPKYDRNGKWVVHVEDVATRRGYERKGFATALLTRAKERAAAFEHESTPWITGCTRDGLDCDPENVPLYTKNGFRQHGVHMRRDH